MIAQMAEIEAIEGSKKWSRMTWKSDRGWRKKWSRIMGRNDWRMNKIYEISLCLSLLSQYLYFLFPHTYLKSLSLSLSIYLFCCLFLSLCPCFVLFCHLVVTWPWASYWFIHYLLFLPFGVSKTSIFIAVSFRSFSFYSSLYAHGISSVD